MDIGRNEARKRICRRRGLIAAKVKIARRGCQPGSVLIKDFCL